MENLYTSGEWEVADYQDTSGKRSLAIWQNADSGNRVICLISPKSTVTDQDYANANLIAAAPELLKTLSLIAEDVLMETESREAWINNAKRIARFAIQKATE